jgi:pimeloyl-ACP methyl ester carboxylesterase
MLPHRRGHGRSDGSYIWDLLVPELWKGWEHARGDTIVALHETQLEDQVAALLFLRSLPYVDPNRIAVIGCSYGGIQTVLAAERNLQLRAAIAFATAAKGWRDTPELRGRLLSAVRQVRIPMLFVQAKNDYDLTPSFALGKELALQGYPDAVRIFPPFGDSNEDGHNFGLAGIDIWAPEVFELLRRSMPFDPAAGPALKQRGQLHPRADWACGSDQSASEVRS